MSARRIAACLLALFAASFGAARAQTIRASVGGELAARQGDVLEVPVTVDLTGAPGRSLGGYRLHLTYNPSVMDFQGSSQTDPGNYAFPSIFEDTTGRLRIAALQPQGATGVLTLFTLKFYIYTDTIPAALTLVMDELTEAGTFANLLPMTVTTSGTFCQSLGRWGDTNGDGRADSRDALIALSRVVGLIDSLEIDTLSVTPLVTDTTRTTLADVDGDNAVTSRDALILLSNAVGLPVPGFRIGLTAAGSCATGAGTTLAILPDSIELQVGQQATITLQARDASGRVVPTGNVTWRTSNSSVAAFSAFNPFADLQQGPRNPLEMSLASGMIEGRGPGTAHLVAEMGPGIRDTLVVTVIPRRRHWHVSVQTALNATTQTGSVAHPFGNIESALSEATDGDTVHVAPGVYFEQSWQYVSVALLGDSLNRPVIDSRTSGGSGYAIEFGNPAAKATLAHFVFRGGGAYMEGLDNEVRNVRFEHLHPGASPLEIYSYGLSTGSNAPYDYGNVLIDGVHIANLLDHGIMVDQSDTVIIRNTTISRDSLQNGCFTTALAVWDAAYTHIHDNTLTNVCHGIEVDHDSDRGRAIVQRNRITGIRGTAFEIIAPVVRMDHNVVTGYSSANMYAHNGGGIWIRGFNGILDSLTLLGDSIVGATHWGIRVDSARVGILDSLTVNGTGQDSSSSSHGIQLGNGSYRLTNSRIQNVINGNGVMVCDRGGLRTRNNLIRKVTYTAVAADVCFTGGRADSLFLVRDSIRSAGGYGVYGSEPLRVRLDSVVVDTTTQDGVNLYNTQDTARISGTAVTNAGGAGIYLYQTRARIDSTRAVNNAANGLVIENLSGAWVTRSRFSGNATGVFMGFGSFSSRVNNSIIAGNANLSGARNVDPTAVLNADTVFWGDAAGPACASPATGCAPTTAGDTIFASGITFANHLTAANPAVPAPPAFIRAAAPSGSTAQPMSSRAAQPAPTDTPARRDRPERTVRRAKPRTTTTPR